MAGPGSLTIAASGAITAPSSLSLTMGSAASAKYRTSGPFDAIYLPSIKATFFTNGVGLNFHSLEGVNYPTGMLGVALAIAAAGPARATATITFTAATRPANDDSFYLAGKSTFGQFIYKTTLPTTGSFFCIARGADLAASISNTAAFFNNTGTNGVEYYYPTSSPPFGLSYADFIAALGIIVSATSATVVTFRSVDYGTGGNSYTITEITDSGASWAVAAFSGGSAGSGTSPAAGTYKYRPQRIRTADNAASYAGPEVSLTTGQGSVSLTSFVAAPTRDAYDYHRWNRTTNGGSVFYRGADVAAGTGEPYTDSLSDATLVGQFAVKYDDRIYRPYTAGYPTKCKTSALYKGRVFAAGIAPASQKSAGTVSVPATSSASYTVTPTLPAHPTVDWIGRTFQVSGDAQTYIIVDVNESSRALTLNLPFNGTGAYNSGSANATASYTVTDDRNPFLVYYSEPLLPNNWPSGNSVLGITGSDPSGVSALYSQWDSLVVWTQTGVHRVIGDSGSGFRAVPAGEGCGAFNGRSVVSVGNVLFWIGKDGIHRWGGEGDPYRLSDPDNAPGEPIVGIRGTLDRINVVQRDVVFANYNPTSRIIRWWVPLDGATNVTHCIVYDLQTGLFSLDEAPEFTSAATVPTGSSSYATIAGDAYGDLWLLDVAAASDGAFGFERVNTVTAYASTTNTITCSGASFPTTSGGLAGIPVWHVTAADGAKQIGKIASNTSTTLRLTGPLSTSPVSTDTIIVGGIGFDVQTGRWDLEESWKQRGLPAVSTTYVPSTGQLWCAAAKDADTPTVYAPGTVRGFSAEDSETVTSGYKLFWHRKGKCRRLCVRFFGFTLGPDFGIVGWFPSVASAESVGG